MAFDIIEEANNLATPQAHLSMREDGTVVIENTRGTGEHFVEMAAALLAKSAKNNAEVTMKVTGIRDVAVVRDSLASFMMIEFEAAFARWVRSLFEEVKEDENSSDDK